MTFTITKKVWGVESLRQDFKPGRPSRNHMTVHNQTVRTITSLDMQYPIEPNVYASKLAAKFDDNSNESFNEKYKAFSNADNTIN